MFVTIRKQARRWFLDLVRTHLSFIYVNVTHQLCSMSRYNKDSNTHWYHFYNIYITIPARSIIPGQLNSCLAYISHVTVSGLSMKEA